MYVFSINNKNIMHPLSESATDEERTNYKIRQDLMRLNQSLFMSETSEHMDLVIPFDEFNIGSKIKPYFDNYKKDNLFHESSIQTLVQ